MTPPRVLKGLGQQILGKLASATAEVSRPEKDMETSRHEVLDLFTSAGSLVRASSAFVGTLDDYVEHRAMLGYLPDCVAELDLISSTDFFAHAIDTFFSVVDKHGREHGHEPTGALSAVFIETHGGSINRLSHVVHFETSDLDGYRELLKQARQNHESVDRSVSEFRELIRNLFDFSGIFR